MAPVARVFSIPPGAAFLDTLARALLDGTLVPGFSRADAPLGLAAATIYLPTRRAARALAAILAEQLGTSSALLPRIVPLGALDDTDLLFEEGGLEEALAPELPAALGDIARRMVLTRLILAWGKAVRHAIVSVDPHGQRVLASQEPLLVATSPADAWHLSADLASLIDEMTVEGVAWARMQPLGSESFDHYWRITLDFLDIAMTQYPVILAQRGKVDRASRQALLIAAETARLAAAPGSAAKSRGPVIVAGSTGSTRATGRLIAAVARLPRGAVVLPGLDLGLDDEAWARVGGIPGETEPSAGHPQFSLHHLVNTIGIAREDVMTLGAVPPARALRERLVSEALRPAETTDAWQRLAGLDRAGALQGITLIEAADEREEALAIAIALREALEGAGTAALATPDREIARRVREDLHRWGIDIEESSGEPLGQTQAGALARLVLDCARENLAPIETLALLHHPDLRLGRPRPEVMRLALQLENAVLRGIVPARLLQDPRALMAQARHLASLSSHASRERRRLDEAAIRALGAFLDSLLRALSPLRDLAAEAPLPTWLEAHEEVLAALLADEGGDIAPDGPGYPVLAALFEELDEAADPAIVLDRGGYGALFERLAAEASVRGPNRSHPRLKILGLLEARLLRADRIVLAGLDEAVWPPQARTDPFLNRPMRAVLGLAPPEKRIGRTAHDFEMALGNPDVFVTRAVKRGGSPTVPSRFLQRLGAVAGEDWEDCRARGRSYILMARAIDSPARIEPVGRPAPRPALALRPQSLSVTRIEVLRRDPYAIYAERILNLTPREKIAAGLGAREFGTEFHKAMAAHARRDPLPDNVDEMFLADLREALAPAFEEAGFRAFHWPRIGRWARAFLAWESVRRPDLAKLLIEEKGVLPLRLADGTSFELRAEADRIEVDRAGRVTIIDFKTGAAPSPREVMVGFAPQLTLEADMAARGAFPSLGKVSTVDAAVYVKFGATETVRSINLHWKDDPTFADVVANHRDELIALLDAFRRPETGYVARPFPKYASRFGEYDHLSRVKEWSATGGAEDAAGADE